MKRLFLLSLLLSFAAQAQVTVEDSGSPVTTTGDSNTVAWDLPATVNDGDVLLALGSIDSTGDACASFTTDWVVKANTSATATAFVAVYAADGTEDGGSAQCTVGGGAEQYIVHLYRISGHSEDLANDIDVSDTPWSQANTASPDPNEVTFPWGASGTTVVFSAFMANLADDTTGWPCPNPDPGASGDATGGATIASCWDTTTAGSFDEGAFTKSGGDPSSAISVAFEESDTGRAINPLKGPLEGLVR